MYWFEYEHLRSADVLLSRDAGVSDSIEGCLVK